MSLSLRSPGFRCVGSIHELLRSNANARWEFYPAVTTRPEPFCFADGGDRDRLRTYGSSMAALSLFSIAEAKVIACGIVADREQRVLSAETLGADEVLDPTHRSQLKWGAMTVDRVAGVLEPSPRLSPRRVPGLSLVLAQGGMRTYGHWLLDVIPKLGLLALLPRDLRLLIPGPLLPWQLETLRLFGIAGDRLEIYDPARTTLVCEQLLMMSQLRCYYAVSSLANIAFEQLRAAVAAQDLAVLPHRRLFIVRGQGQVKTQGHGLRNPSASDDQNSRTASGGDRNSDGKSLARAQDRQLLLNADVIREMCLERGFEVLEPGALSLSEQIRLFAQAQCIVGEQGSALHNAAFAPRGSSVLCLHSRDAQFFAQSGIGLVRGQPTGYIFGKPEGANDPDWPNRVFSINPRSVSDALDQMEL
jgi:capsular polysaccharide biosynthesis protein